jgi:hypothetical protein
MKVVARMVACDGCSRGTHAIKEGLLVQAKMYGKHNYK